MNLSHPARQLLGGNRARVLHRLSLLAEGDTGRSIHALSGVKSRRTTQQVLNDLVGIGLVDVRPAGAANIYTLNRDHVLWPPLETILAASSLVEQRLTAVLADVFGDRAVGVLYGSTARLEAGPDSDIDILIVWNAPVDERTATELVDEASRRIRRATGNDAQILAVTRAELHALSLREDPLVDSLRIDARPLTPGASVTELLRKPA